VPSDVWLYYAGREQRHQIVCLGCWRWLVGVIDDGAYQAQYGQSSRSLGTYGRRRLA